MKHTPLLALLLLSCSPDDLPVDDDATPAPLTHRFSFAVVADPHIVTGNAERTERLDTVVAWLGEHAAERSIELVAVVGDIGWNGGLELAHDSLDELSVPWVPLIGDNEIHQGDEELFGDVFGDHLDSLSEQLDDWERAPTPVWDTGHDVQSWPYNYSFGHRGVHFLTLDWAIRGTEGPAGESADLLDFEGGTLPFFRNHLDQLGDGLDDDVVMLSHHPMHLSPGGFGMDELDTVAALTGPLGHRLHANYAGHYHGNGHEYVEGAGYEVFVTDATWDDELTVRLVEVWSDDERFEYRQELVEL